MLQAEKVEAMYESLRQKRTDVYIQRARQLYTVALQRTSLFLWTLDDVSIVALADPSLNGYDNVVRVMREIDSARLAKISLLSSRYKARDLHDRTALLFGYGDYANFANYSSVCLLPMRTCRALADWPSSALVP